MSDLVWYYARGDVERGPFTSSQIRALVTASKVRPDDLVWREGMDNWTVAREVAELFPRADLVGESPAASGAEAAVPRAEAAAAGGAAIPADVRNALHRVARMLTLLGVLLVMTTSGCESLGERRVNRLTALAEQSALENVGGSEGQQRLAASASREHQAAAFTRGVALYVGLVVLLVGSLGLLVVADDHERWLGIGLVWVVVWGALTSFR